MYCPRCGKQQEENVEYCPKCGISLKKGYSKSDEKEIKMDIIKKILSFIICFGYGFFCNIIGLVLYFYLRKKESEHATSVFLGVLVSMALVAFFIVSKLL